MAPALPVMRLKPFLQVPRQLEAGIVHTCRSGFIRDAGDAVNDTGFAGDRG